MATPEAIQAAVALAEQNNPASVPDAVAEAVPAVEQADGFEDWSLGLVADAVRQIVWDIRHRRNCEMRRASGAYGGKAKVSVAGSADLNEVTETVYRYRIAGSTLGDLLGQDLPAVRDGEKARSAGHDFNARLLDALLAHRKVRPEKRVRDCLTAGELQAVFDRVKKAHEKGKDAA